MLEFICNFAIMDMKRYKTVTIVSVFAVFLLQTIWLCNSFSFAVDRMTDRVNAFFLKCLFEEIDGRITYLPQGQYIEGSSDPNPKYDNYEYINDGIYRITHKDVNMKLLGKIVNSHVRQSNLPTIFTIYTVKNTQKKVVYKTIENNSWKLGTVKSEVIPIRKNHIIGIQIEFANPFLLFFQDLGVLVIICLVLSLLGFWGILKQFNIIRVQKEIAKIKQDFTYSMIHDIKTPLSTMRMGLTVLDNEKIANDPAKRSIYLQMISGENQHAYSLINRILMINKMESRKLELEKVQVNLVNQLHDIEKNFKVHRHKNISFENDIKCSFAYADEEYLKEVFYNLIDNSIKYSKGDDVTIRISSQKVDKGVSIRVRDNGIGISKADQKVIFDKYERASAGKRTLEKGAAPGFGLGLSFVFLVIDAHHGTIVVDSKQNEYSEFSIFLPDQDENSGGAMS